jgi:hypothetical protein
VVLTVEKYRHQAEVTLNMDGVLIQARDETSEMYASIDQAAAKIERQIKKYKERQQGRRQRHPPAPVNGEALEPATTAVPLVVERPRLDAMTPEQAASALGDGQAPFVVFRRAGTDDENVVYRKADDPWHGSTPHGNRRRTRRRNSRPRVGRRRSSPADRDRQRPLGRGKEPRPALLRGRRVLLRGQSASADPHVHPPLHPGRTKNHRIALGIDIRGREFLAESFATIERLKRSGFRVEIVFLEARDDVLIRRFSETRRPHPLARSRPVIEGIAEERDELNDLRARADLIIDTSDYTVHQLKAFIAQRYLERRQGLAVTLCSFGYKFGLPHEADLVFDVRFLKNPNFVETLRPLSGRTRRWRRTSWNSLKPRISWRDWRT